MTNPTATFSPTATLAQTIAGLRFEDLPGPIVTVAKQCLLDVLGTMIAGSREPAAAIVTDFVRTETDSGPCTLVGRDTTAPASTAALVNGTAGHALDFDDVISTVGHPSVAVAPAALAVGERIGATGTDLITAFVAGVETQAKIAEAVGPSHYARGFHSTATFGSFGAAAAVARLRGLDAAATNAALAIAATQAGGLKAVFGTMCKPMHAGRAAANGVLGGELAARGFTSAPDILGDPQGFAAAESDRFDAAAVTGGFGDPWRMYDLRFKVHAACFLTHAAINSLIALVEDESPHESLAADDIEWIDVAVPPGHLMVCGIEAPRTGLEGKFSLRLTAAFAVLYHAASPALFTDEIVTRPDVVALRDRVHVTPDESLSGPVARVRIGLRDGRKRETARDMRDPVWRIDPVEQANGLESKFHDLVAPVLGAARAAQLMHLVDRLDRMVDVGELCRATRG